MDEANAQLQRIDSGLASGGGSVIWTAGAAIAGDCFVDVPQSRHKYELGARITDATAVIYVEDPDLDDESKAILLDETRSRRVLVQALGRDPRIWEVVAVVDRVDADLGHLEIFVKVANPA